MFKIKINIKTDSITFRFPYRALINSLSFFSLLLLFTSCSDPVHSTVDSIVAEPEIIALDTTKRISFEVPQINVDNNTELMNPAIKDSLIKMFNKQNATVQSKGLTATIYKPGIGKFSYVSGYCDVNNSIPVIQTTSWPAASVFKIFNAAIILHLVETGKLSLSDTITKWFGEYPFLNSVTIDHLLLHTSGILTFENVRANRLPPYEYISAEQTVKNVFEAKPGLLFAPGKAYHYSNTGYLMLGIIAEKVSGKEMSTLFNELFVNPLQLKNTFYITKNNANINYISFNTDSSLYLYPEHPANPHGAGCVASTPEELMQMYVALLQGKIINATSLKILFSDMNFIDGDSTLDAYDGRGLSLIRLKVPGREGDYFGHNGALPCFNSVLFYNATKNIFYSQIMNQNVVSPSQVMFNIVLGFPDSN